MLSLAYLVTEGRLMLRRVYAQCTFLHHMRADDKVSGIPVSTCCSFKPSFKVLFYWDLLKMATKMWDDVGGPGIIIRFRQLSS